MVLLETQRSYQFNMYSERDALWKLPEVGFVMSVYSSLIESRKIPVGTSDGELLPSVVLDSFDTSQPGAPPYRSRRLPCGWCLG